MSGNLYAKARVDYVAELLAQIGLQEDRIRMINISAGMGAKFAELANEFAATITKLGPTGLHNKGRGREIPLASVLAPDHPANRAETTESHSE